VINNTTACAATTNIQAHNPHSAFLTTVRKPALGPSFTFLTDATLWLSAMTILTDATDKGGGDRSTVHVAEVFRSKTTVRRICAGQLHLMTWFVF